jgi:hypothetical protein
MDRIRDSWYQAGEDRTEIKAWTAFAEPIDRERQDREAGDQIAIEVLGERIVLAVEIKLKKRRGRPDKNRGDDGGVAGRELTARNFLYPGSVRGHGSPTD